MTLDTDKIMEARELKALEEYLFTGSIRKACDAGGVTRDRFSRWLATEKWQAVIREVTNELRKHLVDRILLMQNGAYDILLEVMQTPNPTSFNQINAAKIIIDAGMKLLQVAGEVTPTQVHVYLPEKAGTADD